MIETNAFTYKALDRIGATPCEQLSWAVKIIGERKFETEGQWQVLGEEIIAFAVNAGKIGLPAKSSKYEGVEYGPGVVLPADFSERQGERYEKTVVNAFRETISLFVMRKPFPIPRPEEIQVTYDKLGYPKELYRYDDIVSAARYGLAKRIFECGDALKECKAPAKQRAGRKPKKRAKAAAALLCGKLFVAQRSTQRYCSTACLNRTMTRKKRGKVRGMKRRKRK